MLPERVDEMLRDYKLTLGRVKYLEQQIREQRRQLEAMRRTMVADAAAPGSPRLDGMPHGNAVSHPTERLAVMFADGYEPEEIRSLSADIEALEREYNQLLPTVLFVDAWRLGLKERELWLIDNQVIEGRTWRELTVEYEQRFGELRTKEGLKRLKEKALSKIYKMAE